MDSLSPSIQLLKTKGFRMTLIRKNLLKIFQKNYTPLSAPQILERLKNTPHKTTIYREIEFLLRQNLIREIDFGDRVKRFEFSERKHHHHIVCQDCKKVKDVTMDLGLCEQQNVISRKTGFQINNHSLEFFGLCGNCK